jgi:flavodoxin
MMKGVVVYHSIWGSCRRIAEAITNGLKDSGHDVQALAVEDAGDPHPSLDFIVVGGATRWPGATRKIKRYAKKVTKAGLEGKPFATFSTGGTILTEKPNTQASELLYEKLETGGLVAIASPFKAGIEDYKSGGRDKGTLPDSEVARAEDFGRELGAKLSSR